MSESVHPRLSLVLPLHASARQAENALASLCRPYQECDGLEVLVVETRSSDMLGAEPARAHGESVRYFEVEGSTAARTQSIALGLRECRAPLVGVFMDGAHVLTPHALDTALRASDLCDKPLIAIPEYRFDESAVVGDSRIEAERLWFERPRWRKDPPALFSVSRLGPANSNGFLGPLLGAGCLLANTNVFRALPPLDPELDVPGCVALKFWMFTELARVVGTRLIVLAGEGAFRQQHPELDDPIVKHQEESPVNLMVSAVMSLPNFQPVHREPLVFGLIPAPAQRFLVESMAAATYHVNACNGRGEPPWYVDPPKG